VIRKRKSVIFSFLLVMGLVLAACNGIGTDDDADDNGVPPQPQETPVDDDEDEATPTPEAEETPVVEETPEATPDATEEDDDEVAAVDGEAIFMRECAACHGEEGQGFEQDGSSIPPHNENSLVVADQPSPVISVVLTGRGGMPRFDGVLTDEEIAEVISYIRSAWDNDADPVSVEDVEEVRQDVFGADDDTDDDEGDETQGAEDQDEDEDAEDADDD
jgi:mono/diheme cytochrome c family protein